MRILWLGNAPVVPSGYGQQADLFIPKFQAAGHDLAVACNYGIQGWKANWNGLTMYPADDGVWGNATFPTFAQDHQADLVLALCDAWVLKPDAWPPGVPPVAIWAPVDHEPIPQEVAKTLAHDKVTPIAMSRFGEAQMQDVGLEPAYVPHGVNTDLFKPDPDAGRELREQFKLPQDAFLVGMVAANKGHPAVPRKGFPQAFDAMARFAHDHDDAWFYIHTEPRPRGTGIDLVALAEAVGLPENRTGMTSAQAWHIPWSPKRVAALYQMFDVLLSPSMGEGFGIPILEAQASGVPVIVSDHSAMSELCAAGWKVGGDRQWDSASKAFFISPSIPHIHAALELAYEARDNQGLKDRAREFALGYDADLVMEKFWVPTLERLAMFKRVVPPLLKIDKPNRKQRRQFAKHAVDPRQWEADHRKKAQAR